MNLPTNKSGHSRVWLSRERWRLYALAIILLLAGLALIFLGLWLEHDHEWWSKFASELGIAAVIAALLLGSSEWYLKESLFAEIHHNITNTLDSFRVAAFDLQRFGRLPTELQERLRDRVLLASVIQRDLTYAYRLTQTTIGDEVAYRASVTATSTYENVSTDTQRFQIKEWLPQCTLDETPSDYGFRKIGSEKLRGDSDFPSELAAQVIQTHVLRRENGPTLFEREAVLASDAELKVTFESVVYLRPEEWISIEALRPTINMVCVTSGPGLTFSGQPGDALSDVWDMTIDESGGNRWELRGAILPGQGFDLWFEKDEDTLA